MWHRLYLIIYTYEILISTEKFKKKTEKVFTEQKFTISNAHSRNDKQIIWSHSKKGVERISCVPKCVKFKVHLIHSNFLLLHVIISYLRYVLILTPYFLMCDVHSFIQGILTVIHLLFV